MSRGQSELWRIADSVAWTSSGDDIVALDLDSPHARPVMLQQTAAYIWEELEVSGPISAEDLVRNAAEAFAVDEEDVRSDILELLARLRDNGLAST